MFDNEDWDAINLEPSFYKRQEQQGNGDNQDRGILDDIKNTAVNAGNTAVNAAGNAASAAQDKINDVVGEGGISGKVNNVWNSTVAQYEDFKTQYEELKETLDKIQKIIRLVPYIFGLLFLLFILFIVYLIVFVIRHHKKNEKQRQQIDELSTTVKELNRKLTPLVGESSNSEGVDVVEVTVNKRRKNKASDPYNEVEQ